MLPVSAYIMMFWKMRSLVLARSSSDRYAEYLLSHDSVLKLVTIKVEASILQPLSAYKIAHVGILSFPNLHQVLLQDLPHLPWHT